MAKLLKRKFVYYIHFTPVNINFGISIDFISPNIEIHLPFCFLKIGWQGIWFYREKEKRTFGKDHKLNDEESSKLQDYINKIIKL